MQNFRWSGAAGAALGLALVIASASPASAGLLGGILGGLTHTVGGVGKSAIPTTAGLTLSGPNGTIAGSPVAGPSFGAAFGPDTVRDGTAGPSGFTMPRVSPAMRATLAAALRQRIVGRVDRVSGDAVRISTPAGARTLVASPQVASALRRYVGKDVALRSLDGKHVSELVGRDDVVRGTVTSVDNGYVGLISPSGLATVGVLSPHDAAKLRVGEAVAAVSTDFGKSMQLVSLGIPADSTLADAYVGRVVSVAGSTATLAIGKRLQTFGVDATVAHALHSRIGKTVAIDAPDGAHVTALLASPVISGLLKPASGSSPSATVVALAKNRLTLQLPNGDTRTLTGPVAALHTRVGAKTHIAALDGTHVRVATGAHAVRLADANACVTVNARCKSSTHGRAVSVLPTSIAVRLPNGDLHTFVGDVAALTTAPGSPVTVQPTDRDHARVVAGAHAANLVDATACATINSGCRPVAGNITATGNGRTDVALPGGSQTVVAGPMSDASVNTPVLLQPLDGSHMVAMTNGSTGSMSSVAGCITLNAVCNGAGASPIGPPGGGGPGGGGPGGGGPGGGGPGGGGPGTGGPPGGSGRGCCGTLTPLVDEGAVVLSPGAGLIASAYAPTDCGNDGQLIVKATGADGRPVQGALVHVWGPFDSKVATGADGRATILRLPIGAYRMSVERAGYRTVSGTAVSVGCTTAALMKVRLMRSAASIAHSSATARLDRTAALRAMHTSTVCMRDGKRTACAKPR